MRVVASIEARFSSTRLPGKNARPLLSKPMLARLIERLQRCQQVDRIVLATSDSDDDEPLVEIARGAGADVFRGSLEDVLGRVLGAAKSVQADVIVEVTGDCPLTDPTIVDAALERYAVGGFDYVANMLDELTFPVGFDVQVYSVELLDEVSRVATARQDRMDVTPYIYHHPERYRLLNLRAPSELHRPGYWLAVDYREDFEVIAAVYEHLYPVSPAFDAWQIVEFLDSRPDLVRKSSSRTNRFTHPDSGGAATQELMALRRPARA